MVTNYSFNPDSTVTISVTGTAEQLGMMVAAMLFGLAVIKIVTE
jgi:hypothetical protein